MSQESTGHADKFDQVIERLGAQHMSPDDEGTWTVAFLPHFDPKQEDFDAVAEALRATPGVLCAEGTDKGVTFKLDFESESEFDPESVLLYINNMLQVALRDHVIASEQRNERAKTATVTLQFRTRHSDGTLLDMANQAAELQGVLDAQPTKDNEVVLKLNQHYATPEGIRIAVYQAAAIFEAHVCAIDTEEELMSRSDAGLMLGGMQQGVPLPASAPGPFSTLEFPEKTKAGTKAARRRRVRRLTHQPACYAIRSRRN